MQIEFENNQIPFYAKNYEREFFEGSPLEKGILFIDKFTSLSEKTKSELTKEQSERQITIPFEEFVLNPFPYVEKISSSLELEITKKTKREMKKQNVPRQKIADGLSLEIYKRFGWEPSKEGYTEQDELDERYNYALSKIINKENIKYLDKIIHNYNDQYMINI